VEKQGGSEHEARFRLFDFAVSADGNGDEDDL
jgi:hypothetical protein